MNSGQTLRVVLDTNIITACGTHWMVDSSVLKHKNRCRAIFISVARHHVGLYCGQILEEYTEILLRRGNSSDRVSDFMAYVMGAFQEVNIVSMSVSHPPTDGDDEIFIICAIDGDADYLVSDDKGVCDVSGHYEKPVIGNSNSLESVLCVS